MDSPNILWIVTTQWRAQACGYAGDPNARTPGLDRLAGESVNFTQAVTPHPFGPFARAALLTGATSPQNGVQDYFDPLPTDARTIAHRLSEQGYATSFFGKWHLAPRDRHAPLVGETHARTIVDPAHRGGFSLWEGFEGGFQLNDPWLHGTRLPEPVRFAGYQADVVAERAAEYLRAAPAPWFSLVSLETPHPPYDAPASGIAPRNEAAVILPANVPRGGDVERRARRELAGYYAHIEATDRAIGRLCDEIGDDALVIVTSVHGDMHGAHGHFRKGWPHEESVRVPLLVRGLPGARGVTSQELVSLVELGDRTLGWAGLAAAPVSPAVQTLSMPSVVALPHQCDRTWRAHRTAKRKLVLNNDGEPWLFFDLEHDPGELRNLADEPGFAAEIRAFEAEARNAEPRAAAG